MNPFDAASPFDARYYFADKPFYDRLSPYVSEAAQVRYLARVEAAVVATLADCGLRSRAAAAEVERAAPRITPEGVYEAERRIRPNIRALVTCIRISGGPQARPV